MTDFQTGIITLMKCAVTGEPAQLPDGFSLEAAEAFAIKQNIVTLVYEGAARCGVPVKDPVMQRLFQRYVRLMIHSEGQMREFDRICKAFTDNGIDHLPLKGCTMKKHYPKPELRYMGDADILIRVEQYDRIQKIVEELGFTRGPENNYECHWKNGQLHLELHKALVPSDRSHFCGYWGNGWDRAKCLSGVSYSLSPEDDFLFQFTHFAKHYSNAGIGCRYVLDLWVFLRSHPNLNHEYLEQELEKLQLLEFYRNVRILISVWFENRETDDRPDFMTDFIFSGSSWGNWINSQVASAARKKEKHNKLHLFRMKVFPPRDKMVYRYPILKKAAFLLPLCWILRIVHTLLRDPVDRRKGIRVLKEVSNENIAEYKRKLEYVGLHFEEE